MLKLPVAIYVCSRIPAQLNVHLEGNVRIQRVSLKFQGDFIVVPLKSSLW